MTSVQLPAALAARGWKLERVFQENARFGVYFVNGPGGGGFLKVRRSPEAAGDLAREVAALTACRVEPPAAFPELLEAGDGYYLTRLSAGERLRPEAELSPERVARLAEALRALRRAAIPRSPNRTPVAQWRRYFLRTLPALAPDFLNRRESAHALRRAIMLSAALGEDPVPSHGDFTLTNLVWETDRVLLTDLESLDKRRNAFMDPVHLVHHAPVPPDTWTWQRDLLCQVVRDRRQEGIAPDRMARQIEAASLAAATLRVAEAFVWDHRPSPLHGVPFAAWVRPRRELQDPGTGQLPHRLETLRLFLDSQRAAAWVRALIAEAG